MYNCYPKTHTNKRAYTLENYIIVFIGFYLHNTFTVWVETTFSVSCILRPWQITTNDRLFGSTTAVVFDVVIHPPEIANKQKNIL